MPAKKEPEEKPKEVEELKIEEPEAPASGFLDIAKKAEAVKKVAKKSSAAKKKEDGDPAEGGNPAGSHPPDTI